MIFQHSDGPVNEIVSDADADADAEDMHNNRHIFSEPELRNAVTLWTFFEE